MKHAMCVEKQKAHDLLNSVYKRGGGGGERGTFDRKLR